MRRILQTPKSRWLLISSGLLLYVGILPLQAYHGVLFCAEGPGYVCDAPAMVLAGLFLLWLIFLPLFIALLWFCFSPYRGGSTVLRLAAPSVGARIMTIILIALSLLCLWPVVITRWEPIEYQLFRLYWIAFAIWFQYARAAAVDKRSHAESGS